MELDLKNPCMPEVCFLASKTCREVNESRGKQCLQTASIMSNNECWRPTESSQERLAKAWLQQEGHNKNLAVAEISSHIEVKRVHQAKIDKQSSGRIREGWDDLTLRRADREAHCALCHLSIVPMSKNSVRLQVLNAGDVLQSIYESVNVEDLEETTQERHAARSTRQKERLR